VAAPALQVSIVIPARNEERRLPASLERIHAYLRQRNLSAEVLVVDDGSADRTADVARTFADRLPALQVLSTDPSFRGKGAAVRAGMLASRGRYALFTDADLSAPIEEADKLWLALETHEVAIGSRAVDRKLIAVHQSRVRELAGILFNRFVRLLTGLPIADTQCGFKAFRREIIEPVFRPQRIAGFGFDPEILFLAKRRGFRIAEVPVRWAHDADSKVRVLSDGLRMGAQLLRVRWNAVRGVYDQAASADLIP
jgi:glycosyltransferase involved in cell wall biosynthesis